MNVAEMMRLTEEEKAAIIKRNEENRDKAAREYRAKMGLCESRIKVNLDEDYNYKHYYDTIEVEGKGIRWAIKDDYNQSYVDFLRDRERM